MKYPDLPKLKTIPEIKQVALAIAREKHQLDISKIETYAGAYFEGFVNCGNQETVKALEMVVKFKSVIAFLTNNLNNSTCFCEGFKTCMRCQVIKKAEVMLND